MPSLHKYSAAIELWTALVGVCDHASFIIVDNFSIELLLYSFYFCRFLHWSSRINSEQPYQFQINPKSAAATKIDIGNFSLVSFTEDVVNNCLVLTNSEGALQYVANGRTVDKCSSRVTDGTLGE